MSTRLTYRLFQDADLPSLLRLWNENTDWGALSPELWRQRYLDAPYGPSLVIVAIDESGDAAGQLIFTPSRVTVDDREVRALALSASLLRKDFNRVSLRRLEHPFYNLYKKGEEVAIADGYRLWYALPRYGWVPILVRWLSRITRREIAAAKYPCVGFPLLPTAQTATDKQAGFFSARPATDFGTQYEALWRSAKDSFPIACGVVRSAEWLRYYSSRYLILEVCDTRDGTLVGYTVVNKKPPLLGDILAHRPASLTPVLAATLNWLAANKGDAAVDGMDHLNAMETPTLRPALRTLGFAPIDFKFALICMALDSSLSPETIAPERWYVSPGDHGP